MSSPRGLAPRHIARIAVVALPLAGACRRPSASPTAVASGGTNARDARPSNLAAAASNTPPAPPRRAVTVAADRALCECTQGRALRCAPNLREPTAVREAGRDRPCAAVAVSSDVVCALRTDGEIDCQENPDAPLRPVWRVPMAAGHRMDLQSAASLLCVADLDEGWFECASTSEIFEDAGANPARATPPTRVAMGGRAHAFSVGASFVCATSAEGELRCWEEVGRREGEAVAFRPLRLPAGLPRGSGLVACALQGVAVGLPAGGALAMGMISDDRQYPARAQAVPWGDRVERLATGDERVTDLAVRGSAVYALTPRALRWWGFERASVSAAAGASGQCAVDGEGMRFASGSQYGSPCVVLRDGEYLCSDDGAALCRLLGAQP